MSINDLSKRNSTIPFRKSLLKLIILASFLSSCGAIVETSLPTETVNEFPPIVESQSTQESILVPPTEVQTDLLISTMIIEPTKFGMFSLIPNLEGISDSFSVNQQTYEDFLEKKIPIQEKLRVGKDNLVKDIGEYVIESHENHSTIAHIQLFMMGGFVNNDGLYLLVGTQDVNGERFILPIQMTFGKTGGISNTMMILDGNEIKEIELPAVGLNNVSGEVCLEYARQNMGGVIVIQLLLDYKETGSLRPEFIEANEKYSIVERLESNNIFCQSPKELEVTDYKKIPWGQLIVFSN